MRYETGGISFVKEKAYRPSAILAVIQRSLVHVHRDEMVGLPGIKATGVLQSMIQRILSVIKGITDALLDQSGDFPDMYWTKISPYAVPSQGKR